jgi:hypothetical protein
MNNQIHIPETKQPTLAEVIEYLEFKRDCALDVLERMTEEFGIPEDEQSCPLFEIEYKIKDSQYDHAMLVVAIAKLEHEEEYATKMLDGAHARMELARQMNEQGEL